MLANANSTGSSSKIIAEGQQWPAQQTLWFVSFCGWQECLPGLPKSICGFQGWLAAKWDSLSKTLQFWKVWHGWLEAFLCRKVMKVILDHVGVWLCERQKLVFHGLLWNLLLTWPPNMSLADLAHIALGQALLHAVALQKAVPTMLYYWFKQKSPCRQTDFKW